MKNLLIPLIVYTLSCTVVAAQSPATEFLDRKVSTFSTKGHPKAKGVVLTIKYPRSWEAQEGERPNVVQKFVSESGKGLETIMIIAKTLPSEIDSDSELKDLLSEHYLKDSLPENATFIRASSTKIENEPAAIMEYSMRGKRAEIEITLHVISLTFFQGRTMVVVQCGVSEPSSKESELPTRLDTFRPLFQLVMNSIILDDKWK